MAILATLLAIVTPACPSWCALVAGHDSGPGSFDPASGDRFLLHIRPVLAACGGRRVDVEQAEVVLPDGGRETEPPAVVLDEDREHPLTAVQARELAAALVRAADIADSALTSYGRHAVDSPTAAIPGVHASAA